jgi:hypothetical protein
VENTEPSERLPADASRHDSAILGVNDIVGFSRFLGDENMGYSI